MYLLSFEMTRLRLRILIVRKQTDASIISREKARQFKKLVQRNYSPFDCYLIVEEMEENLISMLYVIGGSVL